MTDSSLVLSPSIHHLLEQFRNSLKISYRLLICYKRIQLRNRKMHRSEVCVEGSKLHTFSQHHQPRSSPESHHLGLVWSLHNISVIDEILGHW